MFIKRGISEKILQLSKYYPAVVITGARQVGKTTLLKKLFPEYQYVSLDVLSVAELAENSPDLFLKKYPAPLLIDEVQYAPKLFRHLKVRIDQNPDSVGQFILTGSQKFSLMREVSESLAGRCGVIEMETLSALEIEGELKQIIKDQNETALLARGMFPKLWKIPEFPHIDFYQSYQSTYIERDVRQIINIISTRTFNLFMRAVTIRSGQMLNKIDLSKDIGVSAKSISNWLQILEASNQITLLEPYFSNLSRRLVKSPKIYVNDTGLLCFMLGLDSNSLKEFHGIGHIWEVFVLSELRKLIEINFPQARLTFFRDQNSLEVDFLLELGGKIHLLEVKWTQYPNAKDGRSLIKVAHDLGKQTGRKFIICRSEETYVTDSDIIVIHGFKLGKELPGILT